MGDWTEGDSYSYLYTDSTTECGEISLCQRNMMFQQSQGNYWAGVEWNE